jgi:4-hydroxy-tetrahydrodipicolinate synthase
MSTTYAGIAGLSGYMPAVPTPFGQNGNLDEVALEHFCERQIQKNANALVVCGTTGESPTLTLDEHRKIVRIAVEASRKRVPVIAGAGSNSTVYAVELANNAETEGADALLSVVPYYNKPNQQGLYAHFRAIARSSGLPIILYDVPSRTACGLADETIARLSEIPQFVGLKDATADLTRPARLRALVGSDFRLFSGDDAIALAFFAQGGDGCISVTSNVAPGLCQSMFQACKMGQLARARLLAKLIGRLTAALFRESNPVPLKYALSLFDLMSPGVRLPLVELTDQARAELTGVTAQLCDEYPEHMIGKIGGAARGVRRVAAG